MTAAAGCDGSRAAIAAADGHLPLGVGEAAAQIKTQATVGLCVLAPFLFVAALECRPAAAGHPSGRWVHDSGFAYSDGGAGIRHQWAAAALTSIVAGDIFAAEDATAPGARSHPVAQPLGGLCGQAVGGDDVLDRGDARWSHSRACWPACSWSAAKPIIGLREKLDVRV